ncbi:DUF4198 domain-containing protein [Mangrovicoccus ximenensis]|uniref:DUF4198 domain-containing protein n=1 Tax=Mangrovicoccus ximenensis TaxID=1911570 RepID=UPI000D3C6FB8|nr:DUF4198 domain-containing protein [Mangrovicoccus ximenensis]
MRLPVSLVLCMLLASRAFGHEFWISPGRYEIPAGDTLQVTTRIGEKFKAPSRPYLPGAVARYEALTAAGTVPVAGRMGDDPLSLELPAGLAVLVHETRPVVLTYKDADTWKRFFRHKDFPEAIERHAARGLPESGFRERYVRYAKALVAVGDGQGADLETGLRTEIVALENPYLGARDTLPVEVLLDGAPRAGAQLELFERAPDGTVAVTLHRTDGAGRAVLPVKPGHVYLADAVALEELPNDDPGAGPVWLSLWASLSFAVPG